MLAMMTSACLAAAEMTAQPTLDEPAQIMVEFRLLEADLTTGNTWVTDPFEEKPKPSIRFGNDGSLTLGASGLRFTSMSSSNWHFTLTDAGTIDVAGWRYVIGGPNEGLDESPFSVLSAPRVLVLDGQEAMVSIGQAVEYLEPAGEEGLFRVVTSEDASEGVSFTVTPKLRADYSVLMDPIEFEFRGDRRARAGRWPEHEARRQAGDADGDAARFGDRRAGRDGADPGDAQRLHRASTAAPGATACDARRARTSGRDRPRRRRARRVGRVGRRIGFTRVTLS